MAIGPTLSRSVENAEHWVVVGAGSAGCVVAGRLVEAGRRVTLVEAGPDLLPGAVPPEIDGVDFLAAQALRGRSYPHLAAARSSGPRRPYLRGRGVGGSSAINAMVATRGDGRQYRQWGWNDVDDAWAHLRLPEEVPTPSELGPVDRALLDADGAASPVPLTRARGRRVTSAEAYLWPHLADERLVVLADSPVERVVIERDRATAVRLRDGSDVAADVVVVSAGAIHSPVLLVRSGVERCGRAVVGDALQDHPSVTFTLQLAEDCPRDVVLIGSLGGTGGVQLMPVNRVDDEGRHAALMVALMTPRGSAGSVRPGPDGEPVVDLRLLDDPADRAVLVGGVVRAVDLLREPAFRSLTSAVYVDDHGTHLSALDSVAAVESWVRRTNGEYVHASSSCGIGRIVDRDGWVIGRERLAVCDASVFPEIPDVNPHLPTTMLAERLVARWVRAGEPGAVNTGLRPDGDPRARRR